MDDQKNPNTTLTENFPAPQPGQAPPPAGDPPSLPSEPVQQTPLVPPLVTEDITPSPPPSIPPTQLPKEPQDQMSRPEQLPKPPTENSETPEIHQSTSKIPEEVFSSPDQTPDADLPPVFNPPPQKTNRKLVAGALIVAFFAVSTAVGIFLVKQQQQLTGNAQAESCSATFSGIPTAPAPNTNFNVNVSLNSTTPDMLCQFVSLRVDGVSLEVNTTSNMCSNGSTYLIPVNSGSVGTHTMEFAANDSAAYPDVPEAQGRTKSICATRTFTTVAPPQVETKCNAVEITRNNSIISTAQIALGDHLNIKAYCSTTDSSDDFDKIKFAITPPSGSQTESDRTPTRASEKDTATQRIFSASENLTVSRSGTYTIKVWGHTPQKGWKGEQ